MKILKLFLALFLLLQGSIAFAGVIDHFNVSFSKENIVSGEAVDLVIKAVDENDNVIEDYEGTIIGFSETDIEAELPEKLGGDDGYTFKLSDQGVVKFENAMRFMTPGEQEISIYSNDDEYIIGQGSINVIKEEFVQQENIEIISPETGITIGNNNIKVSGQTKKNHSVLVILNDSKEFSGSTNSDGIFEVDVTDLENKDNIIQAFILNANSEKIGESNKIIVNIDSNVPVFKKILLSPLLDGGEVEADKEVIVNVYATKGLTNASIVVEDMITKLTETEDGVYTGNFMSPKEEGDYQVDVILKNYFGHEYTEDAAANLKIKKIELESAGDETDNEEETTEEIPFEITGLKVVKLKSKSVLTWDKLEEATSYKIYKKVGEDDIALVETVDIPKYEIEILGDNIKYDYFMVKPIKEDEEGNVFEGDLSDATKVQTGPEMIIILLISLLLGGFFVYNRRNA